MPSKIQLDRSLIAQFCCRHHIKRLSLFGSVLTDRLNDDSGVDVLVEFEDGIHVGYFTIGRLINELTEMLDRPVDLRTPQDLSRYFRNEVVDHCELQYAS